MKWNNIVAVNIVPIFNRGLPKAVPINMHLGFASNIYGKIFGKIFTPQNEAKMVQRQNFGVTNAESKKL
jgi:hypothetical protein